MDMYIWDEGRGFQGELKKSVCVYSYQNKAIRVLALLLGSPFGEGTRLARA